MQLLFRSSDKVELAIHDVQPRELQVKQWAGHGMHDIFEGYVLFGQFW